MNQPSPTPSRKRLALKWGFRILAGAAWLGFLAYVGHSVHAKAEPSHASALPSGSKIKAAATDPATVEPQLPALMAKADLAGLSAGHGPVHLTVFVDPNCIYCHLLWSKLQNPALKGRFTITYVPVAFLKKSSLGKAETILALGHKPLIDNPLVRNDFSGGRVAMATDEVNFDMIHEEGAIKQLKMPSLAHIIEDNTHDWAQIMHKIGKGAATPTIIVGKDHLLIGDPTPAVLMAWADGR